MFNFIDNIKYTIYYYFLGAIAILEDIFNRKNNKCDMQTRSGDVAVITGGARGIGAEVVRQLLKRDMHVIMGCRDVKKGSKLISNLREEGVILGSTSVLPLDMVDLESVRAFAAAVLQAKPKLHLLINNAGIMFPPYMETADGFESTWGVNYIAHFLLTHLLLKRLQDSARDSGCLTRVVNVSSCAHHAAKPFDFKDINMRKNFLTQAAYAQSKAAQIMFTRHLDRVLKAANSPVQVVAVHPGIVDTDIFNGTLMKTLLPWIPGMLFKTPEEGATTVIIAAMYGKGGDYISNGRCAHVSSLARDESVQEQLWRYSNQILGISSFGNSV